MPKRMELSKVVAPAKNLQKYIWENPNIAQIASLDAILWLEMSPEKSLGFGFYDESISCYVTFSNRTTSAFSLRSPVTQGILTGDESYSVLDAVDNLLQYVGAGTLPCGVGVEVDLRHRDFGKLDTFTMPTFLDCTQDLYTVQDLKRVARLAYTRLRWSHVS